MKYDYFTFPAIDSTNAWALSNPHLLKKERITLVTATKQSAGRGRFRHKWTSPPEGNIYASFCLFIPKEKGIQANLPQVLALSAVHVLEEAGFQPRIKWPNDLLLGDKKVGGILTETLAVDDFYLHVAGIGINVNMPQETLDAIDRPATSLAVEGGHHLNIEVLLKSLEVHFAESVEIYKLEGFAPFLKVFKERMALTVDQPIRFHQQGQLVHGTYHSLNLDGSLNLKLKSGDILRCLGGEVETGNLSV